MFVDIILLFDIVIAVHRWRYNVSDKKNLCKFGRDGNHIFFTEFGGYSIFLWNIIHCKDEGKECHVANPVRTSDSAKGYSMQRVNKGTGSRDRIQRFWQKWILLSLNRNHHWFWTFYRWAVLFAVFHAVKLKTCLRNNPIGDFFKITFNTLL